MRRPSLGYRRAPAVQGRSLSLAHPNAKDKRVPQQFKKQIGIAQIASDAGNPVQTELALPGPWRAERLFRFTGASIHIPYQGGKSEILSCILTKMRETQGVRLFLFIARKIVG